MGAIRSAYSCPVFWYEGQLEPDMMIWYFADECAGLFPHRHSFQTHYQFEKDMDPNDIGEQPGARPYNKGFGPIGAPRAGVEVQGDLNWFVNGVPSSLVGSLPPLDCPRFEDGGLIALPPPNSFTTSDLAGFTNPELPVFPLSKVGDVPYHFVYQAPDFASPGEPYHIEWGYDYPNMRVVLTVNDGPLGHLTTVQPTFVQLLERPDGWVYWYHWEPGLPLPSQEIFIEVGKCIPLL